MRRVVSAIEAGRASLAVSGALLRDAEVMLALKQRGALAPMALSGPEVSPLIPIGDRGIARAAGQQNGVLLVIDPGQGDQLGLQKLATRLKDAPHKPTIVVVAQQFNPLAFRFTFPGFKVDHIKERGKSFLESLPLVGEATDEAAPEVAKVKVGKAKDTSGPRFLFAGREEELETMKGLLSEPGPIVVSGPSGMGRTWLVEHAIAASGLTRLPDLTLGRGAGADTLLARLAEVTREGGSDALASVLTSPHTPLQAIDAALEALQAAAGTASQVMVVRGIDGAMGREGDFFRKSRLELLLARLLTGTYPLRLIFLALRQPVFYREGASRDLRRLELAGLKGRFYHDIFQAYKAPEFPRDKFGPLTEKLHGHPVAVRSYAIAVRNRQDGLSLLDDAKFMKMDDVNDVAPLKKYFERQVEKLQPAARATLARLAHFRVAVSGATLGELGLGRKDRNQLLADGLLDMVGTEEDKRYRVHRLVSSVFPLREIDDFRHQAQFSQMWARMAGEASGVERLALLQETNRCAYAGRTPRSSNGHDFPDADPALESVYGLLRGQTMRLGMARERLEQVLAADPGNADAWLLVFEGMRRGKAAPEQVDEAMEKAVADAPVPEIFHEAVNWYLHRKNRNKAVAVLEAAVALLPDESRLRTRLASLLMRQGRRPEAIEQLRMAMEADPMLPDAYGLLGMARRDEGVDSIAEAETLLREAVRLAPADDVQISRLVSLLMDVARIDESRRAELLQEARELLEAQFRVSKESPEIALLLATLVREQGGDLERVGWFLKKARKVGGKARDMQSRIRHEEALLDLARGALDPAEKTLRELMRRDPSSHRLCASLALVLEAREMLIPAHAEMSRAMERTGQHSLIRRAYELRMASLQARIEAMALAMLGGVAPEASEAPEAAIEAPEEAAVEAAPADEAPAEESAGDDVSDLDEVAGFEGASSGSSWGEDEEAAEESADENTDEA